MDKPLDNNLSGYEAEHNIDLSAAELARLDAMAACALDGREPQPIARFVVGAHRLGNNLALLMVGCLLLLGAVQGCAPDPVPGESQAWMGESLKAQVARGGLKL